MAGLDIQSKVKKGLRKANAAVGENPFDIFKEVKIVTGGDGITPPTTTTEDVELVDAVFQSYDQKSIDGTVIQAGDRRIVCNGDVPLAYGDIIKENNVRYMVQNVDNITPAGIPLAYKAQVRKQ